MPSVNFKCSRCGPRPSPSHHLPLTRRVSGPLCFPCLIAVAITSRTEWNRSDEGGILVVLRGTAFNFSSLSVMLTGGLPVHNVCVHQVSTLPMQLYICQLVLNNVCGKLIHLANQIAVVSWKTDSRSRVLREAGDRSKSAETPHSPGWGEGRGGW